MRDAFAGRSVLVIGDSTGRRQYGTLCATLNATRPRDVSLAEADAPHVIDFNKGKVTEPSPRSGYAAWRRLPAAPGERADNWTHYGYYTETCLNGLAGEDVGRFMSNELTQLGYAVVLFIMGPWEYSGKFECLGTGTGRWNSTVALFDRLTNLSAAHPETKFIWRTWAGPNNKGTQGEVARSNAWKSAAAHNHFMKTLIHRHQRERYLSAAATGWNGISYIDWGAAMGPRTFPEGRRIAGDIDNHFGFEARVAFDQMLTNHLLELDRQDRGHLPPAPWLLDDAVDAAADCARAGLDPYYCLGTGELEEWYERFLTKSVAVRLTRAEEEQLRKARVDFCYGCIWDNKIPCSYRLLYITGHYQVPEHQALVDVMKATSACNGSSTTV
jgi:hypothetical protein